MVAGALHFSRPEFYLKIMPPYIPWHVAVVRVSGFFEILGGVGPLAPRTPSGSLRAAALLIAVFPANVYIATNPIEAGATSIAPASSVATTPVAGALYLVGTLDLVGTLVRPASFGVSLKHLL